MELKLTKTLKDFEENMTISRAIKVFNDNYIPSMRASVISRVFLMDRIEYREGDGDTLLEVEQVNGGVLRLSKERFLHWMADEEYKNYYHEELKKHKRRYRK